MNNSNKDKNSSKLVLPGVLTFTRSIEPSPAVFYAQKSLTVEKQIIEASDHRLRATFGDYKTGFSGAKNSQELTEGNLHYVESAFLPIGYDMLSMSFSFKVLNNAMSASSCSNNEVRAVVDDFIQAYVEAGGASAIAVEYVKALIRGDFLWRNKKIMEDIVIDVSVNNIEYRFDFPNDGNVDAMYKMYHKQIAEIAEVFAKALTTPYQAATVKVTASGVVGDGQQVYPSQEFNEKKKDDPSRILAKRTIGGKKAVVFTAEKVGNALRCVDIWYQPDAKYPLPVEPFGIDRTQSIAHRHANKNNLFSLMENNLIPMTAELKAGGEVTGDMHFIFACFIRGGLFNGEGKKKPDTDKGAKKGKKGNDSVAEDAIGESESGDQQSAAA